MVDVLLEKLRGLNSRHVLVIRLKDGGECPVKREYLAYSKLMKNMFDLNSADVIPLPISSQVFISIMALVLFADEEMALSQLKPYGFKVYESEWRKVFMAQLFNQSKEIIHEFIDAVDYLDIQVLRDIFGKFLKTEKIEDPGFKVDLKPKWIFWKSKIEEAKSLKKTDPEPIKEDVWK